MSEGDTISETARRHLQLHMTEGVGPITLNRLIERFGDAESVLGASVAELCEVDRVGRQTAESIRRAGESEDAVKREVELAREGSVRILCREDAEYPQLLRHAPDAPICLYVKGTLAPQDRVSLAIVGSRKPTHNGQDYARQFALDLAHRGMTIVSGLAYGIDAAAHCGALAAGGRTIGVLGNGLGDIYPPLHRDLAEEILQSGALVSELPMETPPEATNFPRRNRIIAGMTLGTLVVEGGSRSGAMITARLANDYNREVFAVPGRPDSMVSLGPNGLIRQGAARLVMTASDVLDDLGDVGRILREYESGKPNGAEADPPPLAFDLSDTEKKVLDAVGDEPLPMEAVVDEARLPSSLVAAAMTTLQLKRMIKQLPGGVFVRAHRPSG